MDVDDIDRYLERCEKVLLQDRHPVPDAATFPLDPALDTTPSQLSDSWSAFHASHATETISQHPVPSDTSNKNLPLMPGERLKTFEARDVTGTLPKDYGTVLDAAAQVIGVDEVDVAEVVESFERRMGKARLADGQRSKGPLRGRITTTGPRVER